MSELVTAEQIEAFRTNGFVVDDDLLTDAELDTFEPLLTAAVAYPLGRRRAHARGPLAVPAVVRQADVAKAGQSSSADIKPSSSSAISCSPRPRSLRPITRFRTTPSNGSRYRSLPGIVLRSHVIGLSYW